MTPARSCSACVSAGEGPDGYVGGGGERFRMTHHASPHSPSATCSCSQLSGWRRDASRAACSRPRSASVSPFGGGGGDLVWAVWVWVAERRRLARSVGSGEEDEMSSGWTREALCVILVGPRVDKDERLINHVGRGK